MNPSAWPEPVFQPLQADDPRELGGYRIMARLGAGGMGRVYLATTQSGRRLAVKVIRPEFADDPEFRRRFQHEVMVAQRVQGPRVAPLIDADPNGPRPWLAAAYVPGPSLTRIIAEHGPLPVPAVRMLTAGVAEALQAVHAADVVHRDLKPSNVLLAADGPYVIDFGIARAADATPLTRTGVRIGSPHFMSPEQALGHAPTPAIDVFALGALAFFAATGRAPFGDGPDAAVLFRISSQEPDLADCPPEIRPLVERCLDKDPRRRPAPAEIVAELRGPAPAWGWVPAEITQRLPAYEATPTAPLRASGPSGGRRLAVLGAGALALTLLTVIAVVGLTGGDEEGGGPNTAVTGRTTAPASSPSPPASAPTDTASTGPAGAATPTGPWPGEPTGAIYETGSVVVSSSTFEEVFDFDDNDHTGSNASLGGDIIFRDEDGLGGVNAATFSRRQGTAAPTLEDCRGLGADRWAPVVEVAEFERRTIFCLRSSEGRYGYLRPQSVDYIDDEEKRNVSKLLFYFVLWKKPGDR